MSPLVLHVVPTLSPYGAERIAVELAARLPSRGFRTRLVVLFDGHGGALWREVRDRGIPWSLVAARSGSRLGIVRTLRRMIREEGDRAPAIVHAHLFGADFWTSIARFGIREESRPRFVSTSHSVDRDDSAIRRAARAWSVRRMDAVVAISQEVRRYAREDLGVLEKRIQMIPNGTDLVRLHERGSRPFQTPPHLLMVGRLGPEKGHDTVLRALARIPGPWRLSIAGEGSLGRHLKETAERLGIISRVHFLGERTDVPALLADADLFLFPSRWEGMGLALLEAAASGVPAIASDIPACREFLPAASLVPVDDVPAWTRAIMHAFSNPTALLARASRLAPTIRKRYDMETMVDRYAGLYKELLGV